ncbi:unnamed protein product, partial [Linum tenue]
VIKKQSECFLWIIYTQKHLNSKVPSTTQAWRKPTQCQNFSKPGSSKLKVTTTVTNQVC